MDERHETEFPVGFFARDDETDDGAFYAFDRFVTHIDDGAIEAVGSLYEELGLCGPGSGAVLDICSSWISHFPDKPERLVITGMNANELAANEMADEWVVQDLNTDPILPFEDGAFAGVTCAVSVDYLTRPLDVFAEVARVLRPGGVFVCTFSNRCFPTKAIRGWLANDEHARVQIVGRYFELTDGFDAPIGELRNHGAAGDPLYAVAARRAAAAGSRRTAQRLAVYGTLRPGGPNHHELAHLDGRWVEGRVRGELSAAGWGSELGFPGIVLDPAGPEVTVHVIESDRLTPQEWERLDAFEGPGYRRVPVVVETDSGEIQASIYELALGEPFSELSPTEG